MRNLFTIENSKFKFQHNGLMIFMGVKFIAGARRKRTIPPGGNNDRDIDERQTRERVIPLEERVQG